MSDRFRPRVLDLFSGAGGMALGFEAAGGQCVGAVEWNEAAAKTFGTMFAHEEPVVFGGPVRGDVNQISAREVLSELRHAPDIIVGGPPCQSFAKIGRGRQRSLLNDAEIERDGGIYNPGRNELYQFFLETVREARPLAFVMENVPSMREVLGVDRAYRIAREAAHCGYNVRYFLLNAAWYGVPQHRWRIFFVGLRRDLGHDAIPSPPPRTHVYDGGLPEGISVPEDPWMVWGPDIPAVEDPQPLVTTRDALKDLPRQRDHLKDQAPVEQRLPYRRAASAWALDVMRAWPGRINGDDVSGNWYRNTRRDFRIFKDMASNDRYPQALMIAQRHFQEALERLRREGKAPRPGTSDWEALRKQYVPPYRNDGFEDKWRKLDPDQPSWTVTAHLSHDTYSHIHYHSAQARTITIREAARLQSFPDAFEFQGNRGDCYRQIGNAVPPLLARAIAQQLFKQLREHMRRSEQRSSQTDAHHEPPGR